METYPLPARRLIEALREAAERRPEQAVAFQGAPGAYSHQAVTEAVPEGLPLPCFAFEDALDAVRLGRAGTAMIPIENSLHGRVADVHALLPESGLVIVGEHFLPVRHCLLAAPGVRLEQVTEALSHEQALGQCRRRLRSMGLRPVPYPDTAGAAAFVAETRPPQTAAIASALAGELYGLDRLAEGIADEEANTTRFLLVARVPRRPAPGEGPLMTTLLFEVRNVPAALYKALGGFATNGINMTKLESYQLGHSFNATQFYADIEGSPDDPAVARALEELAFHSKHVRILGTYRQTRPRATLPPLGI